jgi:hypothetical protein
MVTVHLANSKELSPAKKAYSSLARQENRRILWNLKVHHRIHNSPPLVPMPSQNNPVHALPFRFFKIHVNIVHHARLGLPSWPTSLRYSHQNSIHISLFRNTCHMPRPSHLLCLITRTICIEDRQWMMCVSARMEFYWTDSNSEDNSLLVSDAVSFGR